MPITPYIQLMRPLQWVKSVFVIAPIFFALKWQDAGAWMQIMWAVLAFAVAASAVYIVNDSMDIEGDKKHPKKSKRPLAAGTAKPHIAALQALGLVVLSLCICRYYLPPEAVYVVGAYLVLNVFYSQFFKRFAVIDVVILACFYILRVLMGCVAIDVPATSWIILTTFFLSLTIGFAKRNADLRVAQFASDKPNLQGYNQALMICLLGICTAASLITYAIYAVEKQQLIGSETLVYSVILVAAGFFRFLSLALVSGDGSEPERILLKDRPLLLISVAWFLVTLWSINV